MANWTVLDVVNEWLEGYEEKATEIQFRCLLGRTLRKVKRSIGFIGVSLIEEKKPKGKGRKGEKQEIYKYMMVCFIVT